MTRDYNKQRRDDVRPSSRNQFTGRQRDEQSPRPARPRLNRETVDRAWEAGASTQHADYRPRRSNTFNGQAPRDNRRYNQSSEQSSAPNGRKPFGNRPDSNRRFERTTPDNNSSSRSRSFNSDRGRFDDQRPHEYRQRPEDRHHSGNRPGYRDSAQPPAYERRSPYRDNDQNRGFQRREPDRQPREFGRGNRSPRNFGDAPREFGRDNRPPRNFVMRHVSSDGMVALNATSSAAPTINRPPEMFRTLAGKAVQMSSALILSASKRKITGSRHKMNSLKAIMSVLAHLNTRGNVLNVPQGGLPRLKESPSA
jgi:hypothetical protein